MKVVGGEPFETGLLLAGDVDPKSIRRQLSRWTDSGRLYQFRRGLYAVAPPFQKVRPHPFLVANRMVLGSDVSLQSALAHYGLIPEAVPVATSVTSSRPGRWETPLGAYEFRHIQMDLLTGYRWLEVADGQRAYVASLEKALLDLVYLEPEGDSSPYLKELRLQHLDILDLDELRRLAAPSGKPKLKRAAERTARLAAEDPGGGGLGTGRESSPMSARSWRVRPTFLC